MLNAKRREFCRLFFETRNGPASYKEVYGVGGNTANANSSRLLNDAEVKAYIARLDEIANQYVIKEMADEWKKTREVRREIAYVDPADLVDDDGNVKPLKQIPKPARKAIKKIKTRTVTRPNGTTIVTREAELKPVEAHLTALEDKFSILPDNQRKAQEINVNVRVSAEERSLRLAQILAEYERRGKEMAALEQEELRMLPPSNGEANGTS